MFRKMNVIKESGIREKNCTAQGTLLKLSNTLSLIDYGLQSEGEAGLTDHDVIILCEACVSFYDSLHALEKTFLSELEMPERPTNWQSALERSEDKYGALLSLAGCPSDIKKTLQTCFV